MRFKCKWCALTTCNHFKSDKGKTPTSFIFLVVLCNFLIPSTIKDLLWNRWETANLYKEGRHIGINKFSNWLTEMQLKFIAKQGKKSISEEVKRRKFLNHLQQYVEATWIFQMKEDWTYAYPVQQTWLYETLKRYIAGPTTTTQTRQQTSSTQDNPDCKRLGNLLQ